MSDIKACLNILAKAGFTHVSGNVNDKGMQIAFSECFGGRGSVIELVETSDTQSIEFWDRSSTGTVKGIRTLLSEESFEHVLREIIESMVN